MPEPNEAENDPIAPQDANPANPAPATPATNPAPASTPGAIVPRDDDSEPVSVTDIERILSAAWHRFNGYDDQSARLKGRYRLIREGILGLTWFTTFVAVLSAITEGATLARAYAVVVTILLTLFSLRWFLTYYKDRDFYEWKKGRAKKLEERAALEKRIAAGEQVPPAPQESSDAGPWARYMKWRQGPVDDWFERAAADYARIVKDWPYLLRRIVNFLTSKYSLYGLGYLWMALYSLRFAIDPNTGRALLEPVINAFAYNSEEVFKLTLVALPLISSALLAFANFFESGKAWVGIRVSAETIRRGIYTLRVMRWVHGDHLTKAALRDLDTRIREASDNLEKSGVTTPNLTDPFFADTIYQPNAYAIDEPEQDKGYSEINTLQYITWRLLPQTNWYRKRSSKDYHYTRVYRFMILGVGTLGAFLAAAGLGELVAVTVALANGLNALLGLRQHEFSYSIYVRTIQRLESRYRDFAITFGAENYAKTPAQLTEQQRNELLRFVYDIEKIFNDERDLWKLSILQGQEVTEGALAQMVNTYGTPDFDPNQYMERGFIESKNATPAGQDDRDDEE